ncbi:MAG: hypothetical protein U0R18_11065 [Mycobacterium sp.]
MSGSWWIPVAIVVLVGALLIGLAASRTKPVEPVELPPWDWPQDYFDAVGRLGRRIDPMPARLLPIHDNPDIAHIASTAADIAELRTDKPQFWQWALFTSVLLQRREKVRDRLRTCSLGYQPTGDPMRARAYAMLISQLLLDRFELLRQMERFMSSPGFRAAFGYDGDRDDADPDAIVQMANRLMDHHDDLLEQTEVCITLGVETEAVSLAHDAWAYFLHPLVDMDTFMVTLRDRVAQAQELLPYLKGDIELEPAVLDLDPPDGLLDAVSAQTRRLLQPTTGPSAL